MTRLLTIPLIGRFGNLLFQYAHARAWAEKNSYELCLPPWIGEKVFEIPEAVRPEKYPRDVVWSPENLRQNQRDLIYTRKQVREWFRFRPEIADRLYGHEPPPGFAVLNVRQGQDYLDAGLVVISGESYMAAALSRGFNLSQTEYETDTDPTLLEGFGGDILSSGLNTTMACIPSFYRLMKADTLFRANSTFSWWAATLGHGRVFSPVIVGLKGGIPNQRCDNFVDGNWPRMVDSPDHSDLYLKEE